MAPHTTSISLTDVQLDCLRALASDCDARFSLNRMFYRRISHRAGTSRALKGLVKKGMADVHSGHQCFPTYGITPAGKALIESLGVEKP